VAETVSQKVFSAACNRIATAQTVYLFGDGASSTPCNALGFWLNRFGVRVTMIRQTGRRLFDQIFQAGQQDVVVLFAFGKESREATQLIDWMGSRGGASVLVTDLRAGVGTAAATHVLFVRRGPMESFHSMAPPVVLSEALALSVARQLGDRAIQSATLLDETRRNYELA
jgi:DNA-binding MurR/RpiR family transcriptional regulator